MVKMGTQGLTVEPATKDTEYVEGHGHHHIIVDATLPSLDTPIPKESVQHLHFGVGHRNPLVRACWSNSLEVDQVSQESHYLLQQCQGEKLRDCIDKHVSPNMIGCSKALARVLVQELGSVGYC